MQITQGIVDETSLRIPTSDGQPRSNATDEHNVASAELLQFIERVERLAEEGQTIRDDIKDVFGEAKGRGYDVKAMKAIIKIRRQDAAKRAEENAILSTYLIALGMAPEDVL